MTPASSPSPASLLPTGVGGGEDTAVVAHGRMWHALFAEVGARAWMALAASSPPA